MSSVVPATTRTLLDVVADGTRVLDLARPYRVGMPQSPNHPAYWHAMPRRHGDTVRADGGSAANDMITLGTHVGTHVDALAHVSHEGRLHGGVSAAEAQVGGRFTHGGAHEIEPYVGRAVLLDIPALLGVERCQPGLEITPDHLAEAERVQGTPICRGEVAIVRSGWGQLWENSDAYTGGSSGVPGVSEGGAIWLADRGIRMAGADTIAFERLAPGAGHALLPAHRVLLVERGVNIIETMALEELAATEIREFVLVLAPLPLDGATGSPVRPLAVVPA
jgi:kynurenine formamidase